MQPSSVNVLLVKSAVPAFIIIRALQLTRSRSTMPSLKIFWTLAVPVY